MATIQNNPNPKPSPKFSAAPAPKKNRTPLLAGIIAVLLLALAGLGIGYANRGTANAQVSADLVEMEQFKATAEKQYYESLAELEEMRGSNEELNALIDQQKEDLRTQKEKISSLTRDSRNLVTARRELKELRTQTDGYLAELEQMRLANAELEENNQRLTSERDLLSSDLQVSRQQNESLNSERAVLVSEREQLTSVNQELNRKVTVASALKTNNITIVGQKVRSNGKFADRKNANHVDRLLVCFNSLDNAVAKMGEETFQLRIINPAGETIQIDAEGSGVLTTADTGEQVPYTKSVTFAFDGAAASHCADWTVESQQYAEGTYTAKLYNKGFYVGEGSVTLK
jgi:predicted  nucleic acid-binding Zn-ribbon protein